MPPGGCGGAHGRVRGCWRRVAGGGVGVLLLVAVLVVQAVLSLRLLGADTAFQDEAAYLWAGHLEWAHWLHGGAGAAVRGVFLWGAGDLSAAGGAGGQRGGAGCGPGAVAGFHAGGDGAGVG